MTAPIVVGVDPGGSYIGVAVRRGDEFLGAGVFDRSRLIPPLVACDPVACRHRWALVATNAVADTLDRVCEAFELGDHRQALARRELVLGVENVLKPHPRGGRVSGDARVIDPGPIIDTAVTLGVILGLWGETVLVRPHRNGSGPPAAYPEQIRPNVRGLGGPSIHARSAWDVAGAAQLLARFDRNERGA